MLTSQNQYAFPQPGQPLVPGQPQYFPGQPLVPGQSIIGRQQQIFYPFGVGVNNPFIGVIAFLIFAASVAINIYSGLWGAGYFGAAVCPSTRTAQAIIIAVYVAFGLALLYAAYSRTWPEQAYYWAIAASILNTLAVANKAWWRHSSNPFLKVLGSHWVHLLILAALFVVLYHLWWTIYHPADLDWVGAFARNAVAFYLGWALFSFVKAFWFAIGYLFNWKGHGHKWLLAIL